MVERTARPRPRPSRRPRVGTCFVFVMLLSLKESTRPEALQEVDVGNRFETSETIHVFVGHDENVANNDKKGYKIINKRGL